MLLVFLTLFTRYLLSAPYFFGFTNNRLQACVIHCWVLDPELPVNMLVLFKLSFIAVSVTVEN